MGIGALMSNMWSTAVQLVAVITAVGIIFTFNGWLVLIIAVLSFIQFEYFDYIRVKDKEVMWDAMAPHWRKMNYMQEVSTDFTYAKDIRLYGMKKWLLGKYKDINNIELKHWIQSRVYWSWNTWFSQGVALVRNVIIYGWLIYDMLFNGMSIGAVHRKRYHVLYVCQPVPSVAGWNAGALRENGRFPQLHGHQKRR